MIIRKTDDKILDIKKIGMIETDPLTERSFGYLRLSLTLESSKLDFSRQ